MPAGPVCQSLYNGANSRTAFRNAVILAKFQNVRELYQFSPKKKKPTGATTAVEQGRTTAHNP